MKINIFRIVFVLFCATLEATAQQQSQYTQYMYNTMSINPAYTGTRSLFSAFAMYRTQWVGIDGAPQTINFSLESPVGSIGQGLGIAITSDRIGPSSASSLTVNYSYPIQLNENLKMGLGISAGVNFLEVNYNKLKISEVNDQHMNGILSKASPDLGLGIYLHSSNWYAGLSAPQILKTDFYDDVNNSTVSRKAHFYLMGGYVFDLNENLKFKPASIIKAVSGAPLAIDFSANFLFHENFTLGAAYRWDAAVSALAGFQITPGINIGYAYDFDTTNMGNYNSGSHEIFMRFDFFSSSKYRLVHPRFF